MAKHLNIYNRSDFQQKVEFLSLRGFAFFLIVFSLQTLLIRIHFYNRLSPLYEFSQSSFWSINLYFLQLLLLYIGVSFVFILIYLSYSFGKSTQQYANAILVSIFKFITLFSLLVVVNIPYLFHYLKMYTYAKFRYDFHFHAYNVFDSIFTWLIILWVSFIFLFFVIKLLSFFSRNKAKSPEKSTFESVFMNSQETKTQTNLSQTATATAPIDTKTETVEKNQIEADLNNREKKTDKTKFKTEIEEKNQIKADLNDYERKADKTFFSEYDQFLKPVKLFLKENYLVLNRVDRFLIVSYMIILFDMMILVLFYVDRNPSSDKLFRFVRNDLLFLSIILISIIAYIIYKLLTDYRDKKSLRNEAISLVILGVAFYLITFSIIGVVYEDSNSLLYLVGPPRSSIRILVMTLALIISPGIYLYYKSPNFHSKVDHYYNQYLRQYNPIEIYRYKKTIDQLEMNPKYSTLIKNFILLHKNDLKQSLYNTTPLTFRLDILTVFNMDFERLKSLLLYNDLTSFSKAAIKDYTMQVFANFVFNFEVVLQEYFTKELLSKPDIQVHVDSSYIDVKFSKIFTQWESSA